MKKIVCVAIMATLVFAMMATFAPDALGQKKAHKCWYWCKPVPAKKRIVPKGCNSCARLGKVEAQILVLLNKKDEEKNPGDHALLVKLEQEFDELLPRVEKLEAEMSQVKSDIGFLKTDVVELRSDLNSTNVKVDNLDVRVQGLEATPPPVSCSAKAGQKKGEVWLVCTDGTSTRLTKGGWSTTKKVVVTSTIVGGGVGLACLFGVRGFCRAARAAPPVATTLRINQ